MPSCGLSIQEGLLSPANGPGSVSRVICYALAFAKVKFLTNEF